MTSPSFGVARLTVIAGPWFDIARKTRNRPTTDTTTMVVRISHAAGVERLRYASMAKSGAYELRNRRMRNRSTGKAGPAYVGVGRPRIVPGGMVAAGWD